MDSAATAAWMRQALHHARQLHQAGRLDEAEAFYRRILALDPEGRSPENPDVRFLLGNALFALRRLEQASEAYHAAIVLRPDYAPALTNLGTVLTQLERLREAFRAYQAAVWLRPGHAPTHSNLGIALGRQGHWSAAADAHRAAIALQPDFADAYANLGKALTEDGRPGEAVAPLHGASRLQANHPGARFNLGIAFQEQGLPEKAVGHYRHAVALHPDFPDALTRLAGTLKGMGRLDEAIAIYDRVLALRPKDPDARWNRSLTLLLKGDFQRGWEDYEARWDTTEEGGQRHGFTHPQWTGENLRGRTILLHAEQGLGDTIQFVRYVPMVVARGGRVLLRVSAALTRLLSELPGVTLLMGDDPLPPFDLHCPLLSLPKVFGTTLETIPTGEPYLSANPALAAAWRERMALRRGLRVGIVWAGNPAFAEDCSRSPGLEPFRRLFAVEGCRFFSLQKGAGRAALQAAGALPDHVQDLGGEIGDLADTAAIMANLDLVISSCTAPIHLAGALGRPAWLALKAVPDWRWLMGREDSPWYPTLRLFRQTSPGDWDGVFARMAAALNGRVEA